MKIYGIIRTVWNGNSYSSNPDEDIFLYLSKEERVRTCPNALVMLILNTTLLKRKRRTKL